MALYGHGYLKMTVTLYYHIKVLEIHMVLCGNAYPKPFFPSKKYGIPPYTG